MSEQTVQYQFAIKKYIYEDNLKKMLKIHCERKSGSQVACLPTSQFY